MPIALSRKGSTLVEIVVVVSIIATGIITVYQLIVNASYIASTTEARIQAINLAREGIEITSNIRDSNWTKFSSNTKDCFWVKDYDQSCVNNIMSAPILANVSTEYIPVQKGAAWYLSGVTTSGSGIAYDKNGSSIQWSDISSYSTACTNTIRTNCRAYNFFRTIKVRQWGTVNGLSTLVVTSTVSWMDISHSSMPYTISFDKTLTNWKQNFTGH